MMRIERTHCKLASSGPVASGPVAKAPVASVPVASVPANER